MTDLRGQIPATGCKFNAKGQRLDMGRHVRADVATGLPVGLRLLHAEQQHRLPGRQNAAHQWIQKARADDRLVCASAQPKCAAVPEIGVLY